MSHPKKIGPYRIDGLLGQGGMGEVYLAYDESLDRAVAIKKIRSDVLAKVDAVERFRREARSMAKLRHPSIVQVFNLFEEHDYLYLVMEYVEGRTVAELVRDEGPLPPARAARLFGTIAEGLAEAHSQGIVHRDIKAQNLMVTAENRGKILDFGLAKHLQTTETTLSVAGWIAGTPKTMSPEQSRGEAVDHSSDLFSLGAVLYETVTGKAPFQGDQLVVVMAKISMEHPPAPASIEPSIPRPLSDLIMRLLEKKPEQRPQRAAEVAKQLAAISGETVLSGETVPSREAVAMVDPAPALPQASVGNDSDLPTLQYRTPARVESRAGAIPPDLKSKFPRWFLGLSVLLIATIAFMAWQRSPDSPDEFREGNSARDTVIPGTAIPGTAIPDTASPDSGASLDSKAIMVTNPPSAIAVLDLENLTGDPENDWIGTALAEILRAGLRAGGAVRVSDGAETIWAEQQFIAQDSSDAEREVSLQKIQDSLGVGLIVLGSYQALPGRGSVRVQLQHRGALSEESISIRSPVTTTELLGAGVRIVEQLRTKIRFERLSVQDEVELKATFPSNPEAARFYAEGLNYFWQFEYLLARERLQRAISIDDNQPMPSLMLAKVWLHLGYEKKSLEATLQASERAAALPKHLKDEIEALRFIGAKAWEEALPIYVSLFSRAPRRLELGLHLAELRMKVEGSLEASKALENLRRLPSPFHQDPRIDLLDARIAHRESDWANVQRLAESAALRAEAIEATSLLAEAELRSATVLVAFDELEKATVVLQELKRGFDLRGDRYGSTRVVELMAHIAMAKKELSGAERLFKRALERYLEIGNETREASVLGSIGTVLVRQGRLQEAAVAQEEALTIFRRLEDKYELAIVLVNWGVNYFGQGQWDKAIENYSEGLAIADEIGDREASAITSANIGEVLFIQGDLDQAEIMFRDALAIDTERIEPHGVAYDTHKIGEVFLARGDLHYAREKLNEAVETYQDLDGAKVSMAEIGTDLARLAIEEERYEDAERVARESEQMLRSSGWSDLALLARATLARAQYQLGESEDAANLFDEVLAGAEASEDPGVRLEVMVTAVKGRALLGGVELPAAMEQLRRLIEEAETAGYVEHAFGARLAFGELAVRNGEPGASAELAELEKEATKKGYRFIARRAARARKH